jgi:hypothetical protein
MQQSKRNIVKTALSTRTVNAIRNHFGPLSDEWTPAELMQALKSDCPSLWTFSSNPIIASLLRIPRLGNVGSSEAERWMKHSLGLG